MIHQLSVYEFDICLVVVVKIHSVDMIHFVVVVVVFQVALFWIIKNIIMMMEKSCIVILQPNKRRVIIQSFVHKYYSPG